jgi:hypothetical protein
VCDPQLTVHREWCCTVLCDVPAGKRVQKEDFVLRDKMQQWSSVLEPCDWNVRFHVFECPRTCRLKLMLASEINK